MSEHPIKSMMEATMQKIRELVDANTVIGDPIYAKDGTTLIPVSKISYGLGAVSYTHLDVYKRQEGEHHHRRRRR